MSKPRWKSWAELLFSAACIAVLAWNVSEHANKGEWLWAALNLFALVSFYLMFTRAWREI